MLAIGILFIFIGGIFCFVAWDAGDKGYALGLLITFLIGILFVGLELYKDNTTKIICNRNLITNEYQGIKYNKPVRIIKYSKPCNVFFVLCSGYKEINVEIIDEN